MILEQAPSYGAVSNNKGLGANYTLNFSLDLSHYIPLTGMWQGDAVKAKSLYINNYNNTFALNVTYGNKSKLVPALSVGHIDISQVDSVVIVSEGAASIAITVFNYDVPEGFNARGNAPLSLTNDPYFASVGLLLHLDGINNGATIIDSKNNSVYTLASSVLSISQKKFGDTSCHITTSGPDDDISIIPSPALVTTAQCHEFSVYPETQILSNNLILLYCITNVAVTQVYRLFGFTSDASGNITGVFVGLCSSGNPITKSLSIAVNVPLNAWSTFSVDFLDSNIIYVYMNGNLIGNGNGSGLGTPSSIQFGVQSLVINAANPTVKRYLGYYDEVRITNRFRHSSQTYTVESTPFKDQ